MKAMQKIKTFRFGELEVDEADIVWFPEGLVGLASLKRFVMLQDPQAESLIWLQSIDRPDFALATVHSSRLEADYPIKVPPPDAALLKSGPAAAMEVFVVMHRTDGRFYLNLRGPLVINANEMLGKQVVQHDSDYSVRQALDPSIEMGWAPSAPLTVG